MGFPPMDALVFPPWDGLIPGTPQTEKCGSSKIPSCEAAYLAAGCPRALETWTVEEPDGWPGRKLSRFLMFGALCEFHGNLGKIDSPCWDFAELVNSSEMLFCLKPSEQVQYLQLSFEDRDNTFPCALQHGSSGSPRSTHQRAIEPSVSIHTLEVVSRREDTGTWQWQMKDAGRLFWSLENHCVLLITLHLIHLLCLVL